MTPAAAELAVPAPPRWLAAWAGWTALACVLLLAIRVALSWDPTRPLLLITSGAESEALFSIWRVVEGQPVYLDPCAPPFAASYFNWAFYACYGLWCRAWLGASGAGPEWIPTLTHTLSLGFTLLAAGAAYAAGRALRLGARAALAASALAAAAPLGHEMALTCRPDAAASALELCALSCALRHALDPARRGPLLGAGLCCALAWSFKQSHVGVISGLCLWLLAQRRWRALLGLAGATFAYQGLVLGLGGAALWRTAIVGATQQPWSLGGAGLQLLKALAKAPLLAWGLLGAPWLWLARPALRSEPLGLLACCAAAALGLSAYAAGGAGAHSYYFMSAAALSALGAAGSLAALSGPWPARLGGLALAGQLALCLAVLAGRGGTLRPPQPHDLERLRAHLRAAPGPIYVDYRAGNLPWIQPRPPHFVYAFNYGLDRARGQPFAEDGLEGLAAQRYFATVVLWSREDPPRLRGVPLVGYRLVREDDGLRYFERGPR